MSTDATPEDVYLAAEAAWLDSLFVVPPPGPITVHVSRERHFRAAVDAGRAPLLADIDRLQDLLRDVRTYGVVPEPIRDRIALEVGTGEPEATPHAAGGDVTDPTTEETRDA